MTTTRKKFIRRNWDKYKRLRRVLKWRRPRGIHNKMRKRRKGYPCRPEMGMRTAEIKTFPLVRNMKELMKLKNEKVIIAKVGKKKRIEMEDKAKELGIKILNEVKR